MFSLSLLEHLTSIIFLEFTYWRDSCGMPLLTYYVLYCIEVHFTAVRQLIDIEVYKISVLIEYDIDILSNLIPSSGKEEA